MAYNKVIYGGNTLIDLTEDTITPDKLVYGYTAHDKSGAAITGTNKVVAIEPLEYDYNIGYVAAGSWTYENPTQTYQDIYEIQNGHTYFLTLGANVGTRFRAMTTDTDIRTKTSGKVQGTQIINLNNPAAYRNITFTATLDGYLIIGKDNIGKSGVFTYLYDAANWE